MHIKVINPNTTDAMTQAIRKTAEAVAGPDVTVSAVSPLTGPSSIESHYDEMLSVPGLLDEVIAGEREGVDGYVVACFGDPGLQAAREVASGPVVGIAEAAMRTATYLGRSFSVVTTLERTLGRAWDLAAAYGVRSACAGVHACDLPVLELETNRRALGAVIDACRTALRSDRSDTVVLGCAGMAPLAAAISREIGVPVVEGVAAAVVSVEGLVRLGLTTSTVAEFASPPPKEYAGDLHRFGQARVGA